jgi:haloacetate dehalogenase
MGAAFFAGFRQQTITTSGARINTLVAGNGPPLLLLHGHPQTHVAWWKVAPKLAETFTVVLTDLRGYGDSSKPDGGIDHINYSKRSMGLDQIEVMRALGHSQFQAVGHDRGARVLHRMALDYPDAVTRVVTLDIAPTDLMYAHTNEAFATKYFWWFFHIQAAPLPERMIGSQTELYLDSHLDVQNKTPGAVTPEAFAEYLRCYNEPACVHAVCEDYRASVTIDRQHTKDDRALGNKIRQPLLTLWGAKGAVGELFDVVKLWRDEADDVHGRALQCGHLIAEEDPEGLLDALNAFLKT